MEKNIIRQLLEEYDIETAEDIQDALKDLLGGTIKEIFKSTLILIPLLNCSEYFQPHSIH